jgi:hypothetical protein
VGCDLFVWISALRAAALWLGIPDRDKEHPSK